MKKLARALAAVGCLALLLAGCGSPQASGGESASARKEIVKLNGDVISIPVKPKRIADLSGSTEELLLLGIEPIASGNVDYGNRKQFSPTIADRLDKDVVNLGWYGEPISLEAVMAVEPDLILLGALFNEDSYEQLSKIAPTVQVPHPYYEWRNRLNFWADLFGEQEKKDQWLGEYAKKAEEWKQKLAPVVKEETFAILETYPQSLAELLYDDFGLKRATGIPKPEHWGGMELSLEALSSLNPDHLLLMESSEHKMSDSNVWEGLKAVQNGHVYKISQVDNYNYSFTAIGRMQLLDKLGNQILQRQ